MSDRPIAPGETRTLGHSAVRVTSLGFGGAPLGNLFRALDDRQALDAVRRAWAAGVRYFDTAPLYGSGLSEQRIGAALAGEPRDAFVLSTKVGRRLVPRNPGRPPPESAYVDVPPLDPVFDYTAEAARGSLAGSLERLGIARVDIVLIHDLGPVTHGADDARRYAQAMDGAYRVLHDLRAEGAIGAIGVGANEWEILERCARDGDFDCFLLAGRYSLLEQTALERFLPLCARRGIGVIVGGPYNSGILASGTRRDPTYNYRPAPPAVLERVRALERVVAAHGVPLAAAALQFPFHHPAVAAVIPGARAPEEVEANLGLLRHAIPPALWRDLKTEGLVRADAPTPA
ncbi:MAG: aldo/keto reductase [Candidatus Rokuibacteriota bacterium]